MRSEFFTMLYYVQSLEPITTPPMTISSCKGIWRWIWWACYCISRHTCLWLIYLLDIELLEGKKLYLIWSTPHTRSLVSLYTFPHCFVFGTGILAVNQTILMDLIIKILFIDWTVILQYTWSCGSWEVVYTWWGECSGRNRDVEAQWNFALWNTWYFLYIEIMLCELNEN